MQSLSVHEQMALDYLKAELREDAPAALTHLATFDEHPLEGEGASSLFAFKASLGGHPPEDFHVVAGQTVANYYPAWGLDAEQAYCVHLGTRFMLVVQVQQVPIDQLPASLKKQTREQIAAAVPGEDVSDFRPVAAFRVPLPARSGNGNAQPPCPPKASSPDPAAHTEDGLCSEDESAQQLHAVCRARIANEEVYVLCGDIPLGLHRETHLPPHVVYRWHLGELIRFEHEEEEEEEEEEED